MAETFIVWVTHIVSLPLHRMVVEAEQKVDLEFTQDGHTKPFHTELTSGKVGNSGTQLSVVQQEVAILTLPSSGWLAVPVIPHTH